MLRLSREFDELVHPEPGASVWFDTVMLAIFGSLFAYGVYLLLFDKSNSDPNAYACGGPGFVDFGCAGGWEATAVNITDAYFMAFLFSVSLIMLLRLINRRRKVDRI